MVRKNRIILVRCPVCNRVKGHRRDCRFAEPDPLPVLVSRTCPECGETVLAMPTEEIASCADHEEPSSASR